jgi:G-patch domain
MMADDSDDYLSDKFLTTITEPQKPKTYSETRKEALRKSLLKDEQNRTKSARQLELESREEGLSKSLFERAEDDKASGRGTENKALSMMMKMGFKPGQALGVPANVDVDEGSTSIGTMTPPCRRNPSPSPVTLGIQPQIHEGGLVNPLPLNEWSGTLSHPHVLSLQYPSSPSVSFLCLRPVLT